MQILVYNNLVSYIGSIEKGVYPETDPSRELYKIVNENGKIYAVTEGFLLYDVSAVPEDFTEGKYLYDVEKGFYLNPDWVDPNLPSETQQRLSALEAENTNLYTTIDDILTNIIPAMVAGTTEESEE